jgi:hypothetical protein
MAKLNKLNGSAIFDFQLFLYNYEGISYRSAAWQKVAWCKLMAGDYSGYLVDMANCKRTVSFLDEDKAAMTEAECAHPPQVELLKSRLLFDGGYCSSALDILNGIEVGSLKYSDQLLEYNYRRARICQGLSRETEAVMGYRQTVDRGRNSKTYFAANSALLLAAIFEKQGIKDSARFYYRQCLEMRNHEFQNSIDQKAKTGIERLNND